MSEDKWGTPLDVVWPNEIDAVESGLGLGGVHQVQRSSRRRSEGQLACLACRPDYVYDVRPDGVVQEDLARRRDVADSEIALNKRRIDGFNQNRNDAIERIDNLILHALAAKLNSLAPLHSETAGMIMDRLSILALKIKAMHLQTVRTDVDTDHRATCAEKLARLNEQRHDFYPRTDHRIDRRKP